MKKLIVIALAIVMVLSLAACTTESPSPSASVEPTTSTVPESPSPSEPAAQKVVTGFFPEFWGNYPSEDQLFIQKLQENTGIDLQLDVCLPGEDYNSRVLLALMANDQHDIIWCIGLAWQYFQSGSLLDITDVIADKIPNLQKIMDTYTGVDKDLKDDNGRVYIIPNVHQENIAGTVYSINGDLLEEHNKTMPETWDEVYNLMKEMKQAGVEYPVWQFMGLNWWSGLWNAFGTSGYEGHEWYLDGTEMKYGPYSDAAKYKEIFNFASKFYTDGLISPKADETINCWGGDEWNDYLKSGDVMFYSAWWDEYQSTGPNGAIGVNYLSTPVLYGPDGKSYHNIECCIESYGAMGVRGKNHEALYELLNYIYSEEGSNLYDWGVEGVTYEVDANGNKKYLDSLKSDPEVPLSTKLKDYGMTIFHFPLARTGENIKEMQNEQSVLWKASLKERATIRGGTPRLDSTVEESVKYDPTWQAVYGVVSPVIKEFLKGDRSADSYDAIVTQMEEAGVKDCIEIQNARLARYLAR